MKRYRPISLRKIETYPLSRRKSKVKADSLSAVHKAGASFREFVGGLPDILGAKDFKAVVRSIIEAITTVNMDFIQHYRAKENVLRRPTMPRGASYALTATTR